MRKKTKLQEITDYLREHPKARLTKHRYKAIAARLKRKYHLNDRISDSLLVEIVFDAISESRLIDRAKQLNPELRNSQDEASKNILMQTKMEQLEYGPRF